MAAVEDNEIDDNAEAGEDDVEDEGEEGEEGEEDEEEESSEPAQRALVFDAGARMELVVNRLRTAHLDVLTQAALGSLSGLRLPEPRSGRVVRAGGAPASLSLPEPTIAPFLTRRKLEQRASSTAGPAAAAMTAPAARSALGTGAGTTNLRTETWPSVRDGESRARQDGRMAQLDESAYSAGERLAHDRAGSSRSRTLAADDESGRPRATRTKATPAARSLEARIAAAARGGPVSPRTREAVVSAAIERLLAEETT